MYVIKLKNIFMVLLATVCLFYASVSVAAYTDFSPADLNRDGTEDILDLIFLKKLIVNSAINNEPVNYDAIDANGNGEYSAGDLALMKKYLLGVSDSFEPGAGNDLSDIF